jgi:hypothetical protein
MELEDKIFKSVFIYLNNIAKLLVIIVPLILIFYVGINLYFSNNIKMHYHLPFIEERFDSVKNNMYFLGRPTPYWSKQFIDSDNNKYTEIVNSPFNFVIQPDTPPINKELNISGIFKGKTNWEISLICQECPKTERYDWKPFYYGELTDYTPVVKFDNTTIYSTLDKNWIKSRSIEEWIEKNINIGDNIKILNEAYPKNNFINKEIDFIAGRQTIINNILRGQHNFFVYLRDSIDLEIKKEDLNWIDGPDSATVKLSTLDDEVIFEEELGDDGVIKTDINKRGKVIQKSIKHNIATEGIYKLSFYSTPGQKGSDWAITQIKINTNKIVLAAGLNVILDDATLYTEITKPTEIGFYAWHKTATQTIKIEGENNQEAVNITNSKLEEWQWKTLGPDHYSIKIVGDQYVSSKEVLSFSPENYFRPYLYNSDQEKESLFIFVKDYAFIKKQDNWIEVSKNFESLDFEKIEDYKEIKISIRSQDIKENFGTENYLFENGFRPIIENNDYKIWTNKKEDFYLHASIDFFEWITDNSPKSNIYVDPNLTINIPPTIGATEKEILKADFVIKENVYYLPTFIKEFNATLW